MPDTIPELTTAPRLVRLRAHEAYLLTLCVMAGVGGIINPTTTALNAVLPPWFLWIWYLGLVVGALIGLAGMWIHSPTGPLIERAGLRLLNGLGIAFACVVTYSAGLPGLLSAAAVILFVAFNVLRLVQIRLALAAERALLLTIRQASDPDEPGSQP